MQVAYDQIDGFEDGYRAPVACGLRICLDKKPFDIERADDCAAFRKCVGETGTDLCSSGSGFESELCITGANVWLVVDTVQDPLAQVSFKMKQKVSDRVFVFCAAVEELFFGKLFDTAIDVAL